jgi:hypothetical protein
MSHPLAPRLSELSTEELTKKYNELVAKMNQAYRMGPYGIIPQMQMLLEDYQLEMQNRHQKQLEEMEKNSKNFKNIIDIK